MSWLQANAVTRNSHSLDVKERVRIETSVPVIVEGDGDIIGKTPIEFNFVPAAIRVLVPV
jgi:diacylglycerol kinase family enzyme